MSIRFEKEVVEKVGKMVMRRIRQRCGDKLLNWVMAQHAQDYASTVSEDLEGVDLGVSG
jgi:hypothetical protein